MNQHRKFVCRLKSAVTLFFLAFGFRSYAQGAALSLSEVAKNVLASNALLDSAEAQAEEAQGGLDYARSAYFPGISLSGAYTRGNNPVYAFGTLLGQSRFESGDFVLDRLNHPAAISNLQGQAAIQMQFFNWQRKNQVVSARAYSAAAQDAKRMVRQQVLAQTLEIFYGLRLAEIQAQILNERIKESEDEIQVATKLKEQGLVLGSDYHLARAMLGQLKQQLVEAQSQIRTAQASLNVLMSRSDDAPLSVSGNLALSNPPSLDWASLNDDLTRHPLLRSAQSSLEGATAAAKAESRSQWPVLSGFSTVEGNGYTMDSGGWNYLAGIKLGMPLFDPGQRPRVDLKRSAAKRTGSERKAAEDRLRLDLRRKYQDYQSAQERLSLALETEEEARNALSMFKKLYRSGRQSIADVMQGEAALAQNQSALQKVYFDLRVGYARTLAAAGKLDDLPEFFSRSEP